MEKTYTPTRPVFCENCRIILPALKLAYGVPIDKTPCKNCGCLTLRILEKE